MAFSLPLRFKQALNLYKRHAQAHNLPARNISEAASEPTPAGWALHDDSGLVARVRADGTVRVQEGV